MAKTIDQEQGEAVGIEQAQDAAYLQALANDEPVPPGTEPEQPEVPAVSPEESLAGVLQIAGMVAGVAGFQRVAEVWNPPACQGFAEKAVPVLRKHAWGGRILDFLENGSGVEELALLMYSAPLVLATAAAARADIAEKRKDAGIVEEKPVRELTSSPGASAMPEVHEIGND